MEGAKYGYRIITELKEECFNFNERDFDDTSGK